MRLPQSSVASASFATAIIAGVRRLRIHIGVGLLMMGCGGGMLRTASAPSPATPGATNTSNAAAQVAR